MLRLQLTFNPGTAIRDLETIAVRLRNFEEALLMIGGLISDYMWMNFETQGQGAWLPLAAATLARKQRRGLPMDMLVESGAMKDQAKAGEWTAGRIGSTTFQAVLEVPGYSAFHFSGTKFMPARDYSFLGDDIEPYIAATLEEYLFSGIHGQ